MNHNQRPSTSPQDNRREPRVLQIRRVVEIVADDRRIPFTLCNLSSHGAAGRSIFPIQSGAHVVLIFENSFVIEGRVRWARNGIVGIAFRGVVPESLVRPAERIHRGRQARFDVAHAATVVAGGACAPCTIRNVAPNGLMIETSAALVAGQIATIAAPGFDCCGQVRWVARGRAGIRAFAPIDLRPFDVWAGAAATSGNGDLPAPRARPSAKEVAPCSIS